MNKPPIHPQRHEKIDLVNEFYSQKIDHKSIRAGKGIKKEALPNPSNLSLDQYQGEFGYVQKRHLLSRTMVGFAKSHLDDLEGLTLEESIDLIFSEDQPPVPRNIYYNDLSSNQYSEEYQNDDVLPNDPFIDRPYSNKSETFGRERSFSIHASIYEGMINQKTSVHWKLFIFLHNLVPAESFFTGHKRMFNHIELIFSHCFKSYKDFIRLMTTDAVMLRYLNLLYSKKETPDENFAREIQELFTVGKRPFSSYTESDVREIARALVGWSYDMDQVHLSEGHGNKPIFNPNNHDIGDKHFSEFYGNKVIKGRSGSEGANELEEVIDMLFDTEKNGEFIIRKLYQFFVYPEINEEIEKEIISPLAHIYRENNYSISEPLKVLLKSVHFIDGGFEKSIICSPIDFSIGMIKETNLLNGILHHSPESTEYYSIYDLSYFSEKEKDYNYWLYNLTITLDYYSGFDLGMAILSPPSVAGWPPFYQEPMYDLFWLNTSTITRRSLVSRLFFQGWGLTFRDDSKIYLKTNYISYLKTFKNPTDLDSFCFELYERLTGNLEIDSYTYELLIEILNDGNNTQHWNDLISQVLNETVTSEDYHLISNKIGGAMWRISNLPTFQLI